MSSVNDAWSHNHQWLAYVLVCKWTSFCNRLKGLRKVFSRPSVIKNLIAASVVFRTCAVCASSTWPLASVNWFWTEFVRSEFFHSLAYTKSSWHCLLRAGSRQPPFMFVLLNPFRAESNELHESGTASHAHSTKKHVSVSHRSVWMCAKEKWRYWWIAAVVSLESGSLVWRAKMT